jgi:hypothetical protein
MEVGKGTRKGDIIKNGIVLNRNYYSDFSRKEVM